MALLVCRTRPLLCIFTFFIKLSLNNRIASPLCQSECPPLREISQSWYPEVQRCPHPAIILMARHKIMAPLIGIPKLRWRDSRLSSNPHSYN